MAVQRVAGEQMVRHAFGRRAGDGQRASSFGMKGLTCRCRDRLVDSFPDNVMPEGQPILVGHEDAGIDQLLNDTE